MSVDPSRQQFEAFKALPRDEPIEMLNLIRFKKFAVYPPGHEMESKQLTGAQAYELYAQTSASIFNRVGGKQIFLATPQCVVTGPLHEQWDVCFVARYPSAAAFLQMITNADYRKHVVHRTAAVEDSRLIRLKPATPGAEFGKAKL